jgi:hypothetical protein
MLLGPLALGGGLIYGQLISGSIVGLITDPSGGAVPDASVAVKNMDKGIELHVKTDISGTYSVPNLLPGKYEIAVEKAGFRAFHVIGIQLAALQTVRQDVQLQIGAVDQSVEVEGAAPLLRTDSASVGTSFNTRQLADLPSSTQAIDLLMALVPGAQVTSSYEFPFTGGARQGGSYFTLNGVAEYDFAVGRGATSVIGLENQPPTSALQEFKVESVNAGAEYREATTIMLITKSGSNKFHGEGYELLQNESLNANNFLLNSAGKPRAPLEWNQFGANLGGPIVRNKAFFFANYSGFRRRMSQTVQFVFPSMAMREGDFSALCPTYDANGTCISSKGTQLYNPSTGQPMANNRIPSPLITSQAKTLLKYLPAPSDATSAGLPNGAPNYVGTVPLDYDRNAIDARVDYQINNNDSVYVVYSHNTSPVANTYLGYPATYGNGDNFADNTYNYSIGYTRIFTPRTVNELRLGYFDMESIRSGQNGDFNPLSLFPQLTASPNRGLPTMTMSGYTGMFHDYGYMNELRHVPSLSLTEGLTHVHSRHTIKAGVDLTHVKYYSHAPNAPLGSFGFSGSWTGNIGWPGQPQSQGNSFADFLLGTADSSSTGVASVMNVATSSITEFYVQDTWQAAPRLTLSFGVRYTYQSPWTYAGNRRSTFDVTNNKLVLPQDSATPTMPAYGASSVLFGAYPMETTQSIGLPLQYIEPDKNNWAPRFGFAYRFSGGQKSGTVLRGGYGVYYPTITLNSVSTQLSNPPWGTAGLNFVTHRPGTPTSPYLPDITFQNPFPSTAGKVNVAAANPTIYYVQQDLKNPAVQEWNLTLEQQFAQSWMTRATYMGSQSHHLSWTSSDINVPATQTPYTSIQAQRPYQPWGPIISTRSGGVQNLQQLQLELIKRFSSGFMAQVEYQWTRSLDDVGWGTSTPQNWNFPGLDYGNSDSIRRHFLVATYIYELPFGKGRRWLSALPRIAEGVVGGWQVSGITTYGTGTPFSVTFGVPTGFTGWWGGRADLVAGASLYEGQQSGTHDVTKGVQWFNPAAFTAPTPFTWGNSARNLLFGPGYGNWDISLLKSFAMPKLEGHRLQVRADFLNAFNHFNLGNPSTQVAATQYGGTPVTTTGMIHGGQSASSENANGNRTVQVALRYQF